MPEDVTECKFANMQTRTWRTHRGLNQENLVAFPLLQTNVRPLTSGGEFVSVICHCKECILSSRLIWFGNVGMFQFLVIRWVKIWRCKAVQIRLISACMEGLEALFGRRKRCLVTILVKRKLLLLLIPFLCLINSRKGCYLRSDWRLNHPDNVNQAHCPTGHHFEWPKRWALAVATRCASL